MDTLRSSETRLRLIKECKEFGYQKYPLEFAIVKQLDIALYEVMKRASVLASQTKAQRANLSLGIRNYRLFHCALDLLENGYYEASLTLLRAMYENGLQMQYFCFHEDEAAAWLQGKKIEQKVIRKKLNIDSKIYKMLSNDYAHSLLVQSLDPLVFDVKDGNVRLNHYPLFSLEDCQIAACALIVFARLTLAGLQAIFKPELFISKHWVQKIAEIQHMVDDYIQEQRHLAVKLGLAAWVPQKRS